jgi:D-alanyl-D-alanine endopeptidase (penicillin-binding protein 7)
MKKILLLILFVAASATARPSHPQKKIRAAPRIPPSVLLYNLTDDRAVLMRNPDQQRAMASITKLMTAMVSLDHDPDLGHEVKFRGRYMPRGHVFNFLLIRSDNEAAEFLARSHPGGRSAFIQDMNIKARELRLHRTFFDDPSGRSSLNVTTVFDLNILLRNTLKYAAIMEISSVAEKKLTVPVHRRREFRLEEIHLRNTNHQLLVEFDTVIVSKTGFTNAAGRCLAMIVEKNGRRYSVIVLGTDNVNQRTLTVEDLIYHYAE